VNCMKCGKEIDESQFFCDSCQEAMYANPIRANIVVTIPHRPVTPPSKKRSRRKRYVTPEEQVRSLRRSLWAMTFVWLLTILLVAVAALMVFHNYDSENQGEHIGQNFSTAGSTDPDQTP